MMHLAHDIPGRLRLTTTHLKHDRRAAAALRSRIRTLGGVEMVSVNSQTGSVIVHYRGGAETRALILRSLGAAAPDAASAPVLQIRAPAPAPALRPRGDAVAEMVAGAIAERLVERAVRMAVAALI